MNWHWLPAAAAIILSQESCDSVKRLTGYKYGHGRNLGSRRGKRAPGTYCMRMRLLSGHKARL
jgi:hypothetical protein